MRRSFVIKITIFLIQDPIFYLSLLHFILNARPNEISRPGIEILCVQHLGYRPHFPYLWISMSDDSQGHCLLGRGKSCLFCRFLDRLTSSGDNRLIWGPFRSVTKRHREPGKFPSWYEGFSIRCLYTCTCILKRISMSTIIDFDLHVEKRTNITTLFTKTYKRKKTH